MKKCILFVALLMSSYLSQGMGLYKSGRVSQEEIYPKNEGDVSLSRESFKPLVQKSAREIELKKIAERRSMICERIGHIILAACLTLFVTYKCDLCPFVSGTY